MLIEPDIMLEAISSKDIPNTLRFSRRKVVFLITPDPFENPSRLQDYLRYGTRAAQDSYRKNECPILCYSMKLTLLGYNQWNTHSGPYTSQHLFDMQVSQMLRSNYVVVYGNEYTESMNNLLNIAKLNISRIDYRTV